MKKIGIITFHKANNYGAVLQLYALNEVLKKDKNNEVFVVDYNNKFLYKNHKLFHPLRKNLIKYFKDIFYDFKYIRKNIKRINKFKSFLKNNFNFIKTNEENEMDVMITGSDQVWNYNITGKLDDYYTLYNIKDNVKKISYAASVGSVTCIHNKKNEYIEKVSKIDAISVRENDAKDAFENIIKNNIEVVLDPTLLLSKEEWENKIGEKTKDINEKYILAYVVEEDKEYIKILNELSKKTGLKVVHFSKSDKDIKNVIDNAYSKGPLEFVDLIKNAEYVVCTSFHATVFSIIFNKKFWVIPHRKTGNRVLNLLNKLEINNRVVETIDDFNNKNYDEDIDYCKVNEILEIEKNKSLKWLEDAIEV